jgi:hypothetical protein
VLEEIVLMSQVLVFLFLVDLRVWERVFLMSILGISRCLCCVREKEDLGELGVVQLEFGIGGDGSWAIRECLVLHVFVK